MKKIPAVLISVLLGVTSGCASSPTVKSEAYAKLPNQRTFENDFPTVWKGIEAALKDHKIVDRDPSEVSVVEMKTLTHRRLETDWIYSRSGEKYQEYTVNGTPRKIYLQTRYRYRIVAATVIGGVDVKVHVDEEIERLKKDGTSDGYDPVETPDTSRASHLLDRIQQAILAAPPIGS